MSDLNIACLISPMADTEGPMEIKGNTLTGAKKIMGKYGEIGLEATITFGEENPKSIHTDILSIGNKKEVTSLQQTAIAMFQPAKHPGTLDVHAMEKDTSDLDAFAVAGLLTGMLNGLENKPDLVLVGRESFDYSHGVVGPAIAQKLGIPYFSGVNEIKLNDGLKSVTATFHEGNDKIVHEVPLPAVFGTTDWLNGKDSARFTSLKGVMMAKKFKRKTVDETDATSTTAISAIEPVKSERKNRRLEEGEGAEKAKQALDILVNQDKVLTADAGSDDGAASSAGSADWGTGDVGSLALNDDVVVIGDHDGTNIRLSTKQILSQARKVADAAGKKVSLLLFTNKGDSFPAGCSGSGADRVIAVEGSSFGHPSVEAYAKALNALVPGGPAFLMLVAHDMGRDVGSYMASQYAGGLLQDACEINLDGGALSGKRIVSNARFTTAESITASGKPQVATLRATAFDPVESDAATSHLRVSVSVETTDSVKEVVAGEQTKGIPLNEAKVIVSGGRGMKAADNFTGLESLAQVMGGAVGASRAVTDLEWVPHNLQIGHTGTTVAPDIYFAVGISGAIQHLTGMLGAKYIVAVNPDGDAPIHKHADLSVIDKWENFIGPFTEEVKKALGK